MLWSKVAETRVKTPDDISSVYSYDQHINISETNSMRNADSNDNFNDMLKKFNILDTHDSNIISRKNSTDTMSEVIYSGYDKKINDLKKENNLLIGENRVQKEHIKNLRAVLSYDRNNDNEDEFKSKEINKLKEENEKYLQEITELNKLIKKYKAKITTLELRVPEKTFTEKDKKDMIKNCSSFSESLFIAMRENTNYR